MISRRHAFAVTIVGLIGGSSEALALTKKESSPVTRFDTDHDGTVDIDEAKKAASDLFDRLDTDRDGSLSIKELQGRLTGKGFSAADPDKDNTLTKDEDHRGFDRRIERGTRIDEEGVVSGHPVRYGS